MDHTRSKSRRSLEPQRDVISDLPRDVLYRIMIRLPLRDAARMSVLSHKWQDIWTSIPHLVFDGPLFLSVLKGVVHDTSKYCSIVSKILFQHEGPILKFSLYVPLLNSIPDVAQWLPYLARNGLRDFSLVNVSQGGRMLSSRFFSSCGGLEKLKLVGCTISLPPNFRGFPKLKSLELERTYISYRTLKDLMGSCSVLQNLSLSHCAGMELMHVVIDAPNLKVLALDWAFDSLELKRCDNLVIASIHMRALSNIRRKASLRGLLKAVVNSSKLEKLCLGGYSSRVLFKECSLCSTFEKPRHLDLLSLHLNDVDDFLSVLSCMQSFPNIEILKIWVFSSANLDEHLLEDYPDFTLHHLRFAKIGISSDSNTELKLIEVLLACSPVLEKLSVLPSVRLKPSSHTRMLAQLNKFRRVSQKVEVICPESVNFPELPVPIPNESVAYTSSSPSQRSSSESQYSENSFSSDSSS